MPRLFFPPMLRNHISTQRTLALLASVGLAAAAGILWSRDHAHRQLGQKVRLLFAQAEPSSEVYKEAQMAGRPAPVQRYFRQVLREGQPYVRGLRMQHGVRVPTLLERSWIVGGKRMPYARFRVLDLAYDELHPF